jgi:hypothetical protein
MTPNKRLSYVKRELTKIYKGVAEKGTMGWKTGDMLDVIEKIRIGAGARPIR